jgi:hypothetical protein
MARYSEYARDLGRLPTAGELKLKRRNDLEFPSWNTSARFGGRAEMARRVLQFCRSAHGFEAVVELCEGYLDSPSTHEGDERSAEKGATGYVYIIKHGSRGEYKIGRTNNRLRREGEIALELPEKVEPIHVIETDDPAGVEAYWHRRFAGKRMRNEWFALTADDVRAFKRWRRIT